MPPVVPAPVPGLVVRVLVERGDVVAAGQPLVVLESMKCEVTVPAPSAGVATELVAAGAVVAAGDPLARLGPLAPTRLPVPELVDLVLAAGHEGELVEHELDEATGRLAPVARRIGEHPTGVVVGLVRHRVAPGPGGVVERVWLAGDALRSLGAVGEPECRRIVAAIDLAEQRGVPLEWVAVSSGARISMASGTENMDGCAEVVRRLVEHTEAGGEVVVVVAGPNVGAQAYWDAEATMLGHCAGMLVVVDGGAMVLTGHRALAVAGGTTEPSDEQLGGPEVMVPNGEAHHHVADLHEAYRLVLAHHELKVARTTTDRPDRDVGASPYVGPGGDGQVGDVLDAGRNPTRSRPFAIRPVMAAVADHDAGHLERWAGRRGADGVVVWDTRLDGQPVTLVGIESHPRPGGGPGEPAWWAGGTLYPDGAHKLARAVHTASGRRPVVVLANLAGFDGSRWSLANRQLEAGAELARAVVRCRSPIVVAVIGRFHGGAYVVLNRRLNQRLRIIALEGARVSVIGGAVAAEVVLGREVRRRVEEGHRPRADAAAEVAGEFDDVHSVERALAVGSIDQVVPPHRLRAELIAQLASLRAQPAPA